MYMFKKVRYQNSTHAAGSIKIWKNTWMKNKWSDGQQSLHF